MRTRVYLLLDNVYAHGGVPRTSIGLAKHLVDRGYDVEVVTLLRRRDEPFFPIDPRVSVSVVEDQRTPRGAMSARRNWRRSPAARVLDTRPSRLGRSTSSSGDDAHMSLLTDLKLRRRLRALGPGVVIATRPPLAAAVARWAPPHVMKVTQEHMSFRGRTARARAALHDCAAGLDALLTLTPRDRRAWAKALGPGATTLVRAIPNASPFAPGEPSPLDSKVVLSAGRLSMQKGFDRLVPAFAPIARDYPDWQLHIYGVGPMQAELEELIRAHRLGDNVFLQGLSNEIEKEFAKAAVYAMSSRYEGLPMVLLEAMSKGVPLVSFDCPQGPRQLIQNDVNGLLVPKDDVAALTAAIRALVEDDERRSRLGAGAFASAQGYSPERVLDRWEGVFGELARRRDRRVSTSG